MNSAGRPLASAAEGGGGAPEAVSSKPIVDAAMGSAKASGVASGPPERAEQIRQVRRLIEVARRAPDSLVPGIRAVASGEA